MDVSDLLWSAVDFSGLVWSDMVCFFVSVRSYDNLDRLLFRH